MNKITILVSFVSYFTLVDFPDQALKKGDFLSREECEQIIAMIDADRGDSADEPWNFKAWISSGKDIVIWGYGLAFLHVTSGPALNVAKY